MLVGQIPKRYKSGPQLDQRGNQMMGVGRKQKGGLELFKSLIWDDMDPDIGPGYSPDAFGSGKRRSKPVRLAPQSGGLYLIPTLFGDTIGAFSGEDNSGQYSELGKKMLSKDPSKGGRKKKTKGGKKHKSKK